MENVGCALWGEKWRTSEELEKEKKKKKKKTWLNKGTKGENKGVKEERGRAGEVERKQKKKKKKIDRDKIKRQTCPYSSLRESRISRLDTEPISID